MGATRDPAAHGGHRIRMRERVQSKGLEGLAPHEIIEFLLFYPIPRRDVNELAHQLTSRFGSLRGVLTASLPELEAVPGVGARTARWLALVGEAALACANLSANDRPKLKSYMPVFQYAMQIEPELTPPCCVQLCLDAVGRLIYRRQICNSLSWGEPATLRTALGDMLSSQAYSAVLLVYTGDREPAPQSYDVEHTAGYAATLCAAGLDLLDVVFASGGTQYSMRRSHQLPDDSASASVRAVREDYLRKVPDGEPF